MCFVAPAQVVAVLDSEWADVERLGQRFTVSLWLLDDPVACGDWVAVQAQRDAVAILTPEEAAELLELYATIARRMEDAPT